MEKLKPCPFCGGEASPKNTGGVFFVSCGYGTPSCGMTGPTTMDGVDRACELWDKRAEPEGGDRG